MKTVTVALAAAMLAACGGANAQAPAETRPANAPDQKPAFAGQTRAPNLKANVQLATSDYVTGLTKPWGLAFLPDGSLLISEKPGRLRVFAKGQLSPPVAGLPAVDTRNQGGLLGLALDPKYAQNGLVYWAFAETGEGGKTNTAVARGKLIPGAAPRLENVQVIWRQTPAWESTQHYGGRLVFARDGTLYVTLGDRSVVSGRMQARNLDVTIGKVVRINADGSIPKDNPYVGKAGVRPDIYSSGHRNILSAALHPRTGELWETEHGTRGGDEINIVRKGKDYGWPDAAYGIEYRGGPILAGKTQLPGTEQPIYYWDPVIAPGGMAFYEANLVPAWKGSLFVSGMASKRLSRLTLKGDKVVGEEWLLTDINERIRDVIVGPDGALYLATDNDAGRVIRVAPK